MTKKILVTLGPSSMDRETVTACADFGVYLFRINLSHTSLEELPSVIEKIQSWTDVPVCLDTEGAQLRNCRMVSEPIRFEEGGTIRINFDTVVGDQENISFWPQKTASSIDVGDQINIDFDHVCLKVTARMNDHLSARVVHGGFVGSNKAVDVDRELEFEPLTEKDRKAIDIGVRNGISHFAMSFANQPDDVELLRSMCGDGATIIAKIESPRGVENLEGILEASDEILIDRGDLSRRIAIEKIPFLQRQIIFMARSKKTPVYVATNLLESMVTAKAPNRAEVNDVVSSLEMGADGLVLAAETAIGKYPVHAVKMISSIIAEFANWTPRMGVAEILQN